MSKIDKIMKKFNSNPKDFTWDELLKLLNHYGYIEINKKGKTGGSRRKFANKNQTIISLHEPHPQKIIKPYVIKQIKEHLNLK